MNPKEYYDYWNTYAQNNYTQACYNQASIYYDAVGDFPPNHASSEVKVIPGSNYAGRNYQQMPGGVVNNQQQWNQNHHNPDLYQLYHQTQMNMQQKATLQSHSTVFLKKYKHLHRYGQYSPTHVNRVYDMPGFPSPKSDTPEKSSVTSSPELTVAMDKKFLSPGMATNQPKIEVHTPPSSCQSDDSPALRRLLTQPKINNSPPPYFVSAATNNSLMKRAPNLQTPQLEAMELAETNADLAADLDAFLAMKLDLKTDETSTSNERFNPPKKTGQNVTNMSQGLLIYPKEIAGTSRQSQGSLSVSIPNPPMPIGGKKEKASPALVDNDPQNADENGYFPWMKNMPNGTVKNNKQSSKRTRQTYTRYQTLELEKEFFTSLYLSRRRRLEFSHGLGLSERQIKIWFQNRRMKKKKTDKLASSKTENLQSLPSGELENGIPKVSQIGGGYANNVQMNQHVYSQAMGVNTAPVHHQNYINQSMYSPTMDAAVNTPPLNQPLFSPTVDSSVNNLPTKQEFYSSPTMGHTSTTAMYSPTTDTSVSSSPNISHTTFSQTMGPSVNLMSPAINQELYSRTMDASGNNALTTQQMYSPTGPSGSTVTMYSPTIGPSASTVPAYSPTMGPSCSIVPLYSPTMGPASTVPAYSPTMGLSGSTDPMYSPTMGSSGSTVPAYSPNMDPTTNIPLNLPRYSPIMGSSVSSAPMNQAIFSPPLGTDAPDNMNGFYGMGMNLNHMQGISDSDIGFSDYPVNQ